MTRLARQLGRALAALLVAAGVAHADGGAPVRIRDVRVGDHEGFERIVVELDRETEIVWENGPEPGEESFYIAAAPLQKSKLIVTQLPEVGTVAVTEMKGGTHVSVEPRARRVRAYTLADPPRLVIDFAPPGQGAFEAPAGSRALEPAKSLGPLVVEPEPEPAPQSAPPPRREPTPEPTSAPVPEAEARPEPAPQPAPAPEPTPAPEPAPIPKLEPAPAPIPAPKVAPGPEPAPQPEPKPRVAPQPSPRIPTPPGLPFGNWLTVVAGLGALALLVVLGLRRRALRGESEPRVTARSEPAPAGIDEIAPEEIYGSGERERALEQRLDQEVRARVALEERMAQANEELKVLRDRLHRVERRREPT